MNVSLAVLPAHVAVKWIGISGEEWSWALCDVVYVYGDIHLSLPEFAAMWWGLEHWDYKVCVCFLFIFVLYNRPLVELLWCQKSTFVCSKCAILKCTYQNTIFGPKRASNRVWINMILVTICNKVLCISISECHTCLTWKKQCTIILLHLLILVNIYIDIYFFRI